MKKIILSSFLFLIFSNINSNAQWTKLYNGLRPGPIYPHIIIFFDLHVDPARPSNIFTEQFNVLYLSTDYGDNWSLIKTFNSQIVLTAVKDSLVFVNIMDTDTSLYRSTDYGRTWQGLVPMAKVSGHDLGIHDDYTYNLGILALRKIIFYGSDIFICSDDHGVFRSSDNGLSWYGIVPLDDDMYRKKFSKYYSSSHSIIIIDSTIYFDTYRHGIAISKDFGKTWQTGSIGLDTTGNFELVRIDNIFLAFSDGQQKIYLSTDSCLSWNLIFQKIKYKNRIGNIISCNNFVYTSVDSELIVTKDYFKNIIKYNLSIGESMFVTPTLISGDYIYFGASSENYSCYMLRAKLKDCEIDFSSVEEITPSMEDINLYPNPASDKLLLKGVASAFPVRIFTPEGIKVLECEFKSEIDIRGLAAGLYFVQVGNKVEKFVKY